MARRVLMTLLLLILIGAAGFSSARALIGSMPAVKSSEADAAPDIAAALRTVQGTPASPSGQWESAFADFVNSHPGRQWVVGRCDRPAISESEAADFAHRDAARQLEPLICRALNLRRRDQAWLKEKLRQDVRSGRLDDDHFAERFERPYGTVWTESVLLDVSPDRVDPLIGRYRGELNARQVRRGRRLGIAAILALATAGGYWMANAVTRGYFTGRLRLIAAVLMMAGLLVIGLN